MEMNGERPRHFAVGLVYALFLIAVSLAAFGQCLFLPFIQDDWGVIHVCQGLRQVPYVSAVAQWLKPGDRFFYRPGGLAYLLLLYRVFGETPVAFHLCAWRSTSSMRCWFGGSRCA